VIRSCIICHGKTLNHIKMYEYISVDGTYIKVGENAKENTHLTSAAYPEDLWIHVADVPGSHVLVYSSQHISPETMKDATTLAVHHSKAKTLKKADVHVVKAGSVKLGKSMGEAKLMDTPLTTTVFINKENHRIERLLKTRVNIPI